MHNYQVEGADIIDRIIRTFSEMIKRNRGYELRVNSTPTIMVGQGGEYLQVPSASYQGIQEAMDRIAASEGAGGGAN